MIKNLIFKFIPLITLISFLLHFVWEWYQCAPFFNHRAAPAIPLSIVKASLGDVVLTFFVLFLVRCLIGPKVRTKSGYFDLKTFILIEIIALFIAVETEKIGLAAGRWSYTDINPLIPILKVSVLPVIQMMLLVPITLTMTLAILNKGQRSEKVL